MTFTAEFILQVLIALGSAGAVYAGIRADLARLNERTRADQKGIEHAHRRIDDHLGHHP